MIIYLQLLNREFERVKTGCAPGRGVGLDEVSIEQLITAQLFLRWRHVPRNLAY